MYQICMMSLRSVCFTPTGSIDSMSAWSQDDEILGVPALAMFLVKASTHFALEVGAGVKL